MDAINQRFFYSEIEHRGPFSTSFIFW